MIARLFAAYHQQPELLPARLARAACPSEEPARSRHIADFIAGMTDRYAIERYRQVFGEVPGGLSQCLSRAACCWPARPGWSARA